MAIFKSKLWGTLAGLTIIFILLATRSQSIGAPVPGGPGFLSVGSYAFKPATLIGLIYDFVNNRLYHASGQFVIFSSPVNLPHGATITQVTLYFVDNGASDISVSLVSYPLDDPAASIEIASNTTSGASPNPRTLVINTFPAGNTIDNQSNFYTVNVRLPSSFYQLGGVRIDYGHSITLPLIMK